MPYRLHNAFYQRCICYRDGETYGRKTGCLFAFLVGSYTMAGHANRAR